MKDIVLNNGIKIPQLGYGVYKIEKDKAEECVLNALKVGYRHIDTAYYYYNEEEVGKAIKKSGLKREEIFLTTKIVEANSYEEAVNKIEDALRKLDTEYIDLMLIHWPSGDNIATYKAMEHYYEIGKLKAIGLSNFYGKELDKILTNCKIRPAINQIEAHVYNQQKEMKNLLDELGIILEAWSPLAAGKNNIFEDETLKEIGKKYAKTAAQVALRYLLEMNIVIIPKTTNIERMKENIDIFDFSLTGDERDKISKLDLNHSLF